MMFLVKLSPGEALVPLLRLGDVDVVSSQLGPCWYPDNFCLGPVTVLACRLYLPFLVLAKLSFFCCSMISGAAVVLSGLP